MSSHAFRVGDHCEKYEIVELIATGGSGEVYRAVQRSIDREVALKCLQFGLVGRDDLRDRMRMESRALARINHPNVVTVFDAGCTDRGVVWIAMELLQGKTLRDILMQRWRLPLAEAIRIAWAVADGVSAAHEERIIHRDIKPENVFVTTRGIVKVLDLGTAKLHGWGELKTTDRGRIIGTPAYMAPEHIRCAGVSEKTDVYALGLLLYEMVAGHPFAHMAQLDDHQEVARLQLHGRPRPLTDVLRGVPPALSDLVVCALEKDPSQRPTMLEMLAALQSSMDPIGESAPSPARATSQPPGPLGPHGTIRIDQPFQTVEHFDTDARSERLEPRLSVPLRATLVGGIAGVGLAVLAIMLSGRSNGPSRDELLSVSAASPPGDPVSSAIAPAATAQSAPSASSSEEPAGPPVPPPAAPTRPIPRVKSEPEEAADDLGSLREGPPPPRAMPSSGL